MRRRSLAILAAVAVLTGPALAQTGAQTGDQTGPQSGAAATAGALAAPAAPKTGAQQTAPTVKPGEGGGPPATGTARPAVITGAIWLEQPNAEDIRKAYPAKALAAGVTSGRALLQCVLLQEGRVGDCALMSETPENLGFAEAAISLAPLYRTSPTTFNGASVVGAKTPISIQFSLAPPPKP